MKRIIAIMMLVAICLTFASCASKEKAADKKEETNNDVVETQPETEKEPETETAPETEPETEIPESEVTYNVVKTVAMNETVNFGNMEMTAVEYLETEGEGFVQASEGKVYLGFKFELKNISNEEINVSSLMQFHAKVDGVEHVYELLTPSEFDDTIDGAIAPGETLTGWFPVEADKNWKEAQVGFVNDILTVDCTVFTFKK